jgi:hypothetical protein
MVPFSPGKNKFFFFSGGYSARISGDQKTKNKRHAL